MIKNIVFDYGAVLIDWNPHYLYDPYFGDRQKADWFLGNICTFEWNMTLDGGRPFHEACLEKAAEFPAMDSNHYADILGRSIDSLTMALNLDRIDKHSGIA